MRTKRTAILLVAGLLLSSAIFFAVSRSTSAQVSRVLRSTIIEHLAVSEAPVSVAVSVVEAEFRRQHPELRHVSLVTRFRAYAPVPGLEPFQDHVTLDLRNIPADEAFRYLAELSNNQFVVSGGSIYFGDHRYHPVPLSERLAALRQEIYWYVYGLVSQ